ncbi:MAG: hypothetical protein ACRDL0_09675, partial [Thermoleophilaceae bacterium]
QAPGSAGRAATALPELAAVPWRARTDAAWLRRWGRIWHAWTLLYTVPFVAAGAGLLWLEPLSAPVAVAALAHAWIIPELYAFRGASVVRPKGPRNEAAEPVAQGLLGDLLGHDERELQRRTGLALERGELGVWLVGEAGALLVTGGTDRCAPGRAGRLRKARRVHCFCVRTTEPDLPPSDRVAHLLLALRVDEGGFATVANHAFAGAPWRVRRRLPVGMRAALDRARAAVAQAPGSAGRAAIDPR